MNQRTAVPKTRLSTEESTAIGSRLVAALLILLAVAALTPCIILPEWRDYQATRAAEQAELHRLAEMQRVVDRERRLLEAIRSDPAVIARFAQRDLAYQHIGGARIPVAVAAEPAMPEEVFVAEPTLLPPWIAGFVSRLPDYNYDAVYCDAETRTIIMVMSLALIGVALWLPRSGTRARVSPASVPE